MKTKRKFIPLVALSIVTLGGFIGAVVTPAIQQSSISLGASTVTSSQTFSSNIAATTIQGGSEASPIVITISGALSLTGQITISSNSYVRFTGVNDGKLTRGFRRSYYLYINSGAHVSFDNIILDGNKSTYGSFSSKCYGIYVDSSYLVINDGTIIQNFQGERGSWCSSYCGDVTINGGIIQNNQSISKGNLYSLADDYGYYTASVTMNGGFVRDNTITGSTNFGGAGFYIYQGSFIFNGGTIINNTSTSRGGGVYISSHAETVAFNYGYIGGNTSDMEGDDVYFSSFESEGATLTVSSDTWVSGDFYLDNITSIKYLTIDSMVKNSLDLVVSSDSEVGRIIAVGTSDYTITESDVAKMSISGVDGLYFYLDSANNQVILSSTQTTYTISDVCPTYFSNGGQGVVSDNNIYANNESSVLLDSSFTMSGYTFGSWNTALDGSGTRYEAGDETVINDSLPLFAQWVETSSLDAFVNTYMHMDDSDYSGSGTGLCISAGTYAAAKEAFNNLSRDQRDVFMRDSAYADAFARLQAWAAANGESINVETDLLALNQFNSLYDVVLSEAQVFLILISSLSLITLLTYCFINMRKHSKNI